MRSGAGGFSECYVAVFREVLTAANFIDAHCDGTEILQTLRNEKTGGKFPAGGIRLLRWWPFVRCMVKAIQNKKPELQLFQKHG